ncbi:hypothetical protein WJ88_20250 [Burkholderia ubonensis]|nr:hypothetical protein WJ88_20250 [Burkholderia ubonensis]
MDARLICGVRAATRSSAKVDRDSRSLAVTADTSVQQASARMKGDTLGGVCHGDRSLRWIAGADRPFDQLIAGYRLRIPLNGRSRWCVSRWYLFVDSDRLMQLHSFES